MIVTGVLVVMLLSVVALALRASQRCRALEGELRQLRESLHGGARSRLRTRESFSEDLELELLRVDRTGQPVALVILSIGAEDGGPALEDPQRDLAGVLIVALRAVDRCYRVGVDEVALILPDTRARGGLVAAGRVEDALLTAGAREVRAGIAEVGPGIDRRQLFRNAYCALLAAGHDGRSTVLAYSPELSRATPRSELSGLGEIEPADSTLG